jgi:hypothetical protein
MLDRVPRRRQGHVLYYPSEETYGYQPRMAETIPIDLAPPIVKDHL